MKNLLNCILKMVHLRVVRIPHYARRHKEYMAASVPAYPKQEEQNYPMENFR